MEGIMKIVKSLKLFSLLKKLLVKQLKMKQMYKQVGVLVCYKLF